MQENFSVLGVKILEESLNRDLYERYPIRLLL
jgi:hypothetical protein